MLKEARQFIDKSRYDMENEIENKRVYREKRQFDYEVNDEPVRCPRKSV